MEQQSTKIDRSAIPVVAIDGALIRGIRESKRLTQLYVANVVGVTTDTISRWENNRYPSVRRDNAEKLATALEVDLVSILRREEESGQELPEPPEPARRRSIYPALLVGIGILIVAGYLAVRLSGAPPDADRWLPVFAAPGGTMPVQIHLNRSGKGLIVKERLPAGWRLVASRPAAAGQPEGEEVKWLIPPGDGPLTISYSVRVPLSEHLGESRSFAGAVIIHGSDSGVPGEIGGTATLTVAGTHWADQNGDGRIDDTEIMPAYYLTEEMRGLGLDWETVEAIWSGAGYSWDPATGQFKVKGK